MPSLTDGAGCSGDAEGVAPSSVVAVAGGGDSRGAEVGGLCFRRSEPDILKEEREDSDDVDGLGCRGDEISDGVAAPSICASGPNGDLLLRPEVLLLFKFNALSRGLATVLRDGLPLRLYAPSAPNECGVLNGAAAICRLKVS